MNTKRHTLTISPEILLLVAEISVTNAKRNTVKRHLDVLVDKNYYKKMELEKGPGTQRKANVKRPDH